MIDSSGGAGTEPGVADQRRSLYNWLLKDPRLRTDTGIEISLHRADARSMGPTFDIIQFAVNSGIQLAHLALAFVTWRRDNPSDASLIIERDGLSTELSPDDLLEESVVLRALSGAPDPRRSRCVIIGISRYTHLDELPAVAHNCTELLQVVTDPAIWGVPGDRCTMVRDPETPGAVENAVRAAAHEAEAGLLVYHAGHGIHGPDGTGLQLALRGATADGRDHAIRWERLREIIDSSNAQRRLVILDCCHSGLADDETASSALPGDAPGGTYMLMATARHRPAFAPDDDGCTAFTAEILRVLNDGVPGGDTASGRFLTPNTIYRRVREALKSTGAVPAKQDPGHIGSLPFFRNQRSSARRPLIPRVRTWRGRALTWCLGTWRRRLVTCAGLSVLVTVPLIAFWPGAGTSGPCSADAELIGYSDALDKLPWEGTTIGHLSAVARIGESEAYVLADNAPPRLYGVTLGGQALDVRPRTMTTFVRRDGSPFPDRTIDGEGLIVEPGSVLIGSETEPSILRFRLSDGRQVDSFRIPPRFRVQSKGGEGRADETLEALTSTADGRLLYAGTEAPLSGDGTHQGQALLRILRYSGMPGQKYTPKEQYAYRADAGLSLTELVALGGDRLLSLERGYTKGQGNTIRIYRVSVAGKPDVSAVRSLKDTPEADFTDKELLADLVNCPADAHAPQKQQNPLLDNIEGMTLGPKLSDERRVLYLVSDDNLSTEQTTRVYKLGVRL
ncbi:hypothetical protein GCM10010191_19400 [Actinomadura vinacea]|uniref:Caspase family protein n=1 Tax=Actinomadura vinacea TaxID=115336 RepID=A0ABN3IP95_9ACTN